MIKFITQLFNKIFHKVLIKVDEETLIGKEPTNYQKFDHFPNPDLGDALSHQQRAWNTFNNLGVVDKTSIDLAIHDINLAEARVRLALNRARTFKMSL